MCKNYQFILKTMRCYILHFDYRLRDTSVVNMKPKTISRLILYSDLSRNIHVKYDNMTEQSTTKQHATKQHASKQRNVNTAQRQQSTRENSTRRNSIASKRHSNAVEQGTRQQNVKTVQRLNSTYMAGEVYLNDRFTAVISFLFPTTIKGLSAVKQCIISQLIVMPNWSL